MIPLGLCVMRIADSVLLTCWPPAPEALNVSTLEIGRSDLDLAVVGDLGQHRDRRGRGVDAAGRFGRGHALHAVDAALVLEPAVRLAALHADDDLLVAAGLVLVLAQQLDAHLARFGEARVHAQQVAGEDPRFVAAGAGANLDEDVLVVVGVAREHQLLQLGLERGAPRAQLVRLFVRQRGELGIALVGAQRVVPRDRAQQVAIAAVRASPSARSPRAPSSAR